MNDTISPVRSLDQDRHHTASVEIHLTPADRLAARLGLWLLQRAQRRVDRTRDVDAYAQWQTNERAREAHESVALRAWQSGTRIY